MTEQAWISMDLEVEGSMLKFKLINGKPHEEPDNKESAHVGLVNVQRRLELLYPDAHELRITKDADTFVVVLTHSTSQSKTTRSVMNKFRCLLVDDEPPALEILRTYITATPLLEIAGECSHAMAAFEFLQLHPVDLIFLDVQMPRLLGTDLLKTLPNPPKTIFTTAYRDYAVEGFELGAVDYSIEALFI